MTTLRPEVAAMERVAEPARAVLNEAMRRIQADYVNDITALRVWRNRQMNGQAYVRCTWQPGANHIRTAYTELRRQCYAKRAEKQDAAKAEYDSTMVIAAMMYLNEPKHPQEPGLRLAAVGG